MNLYLFGSSIIYSSEYKWTTKEIPKTISSIHWLRLLNKNSQATLNKETSNHQTLGLKLKQTIKSGLKNHSSLVFKTTHKNEKKINIGACKKI